MQRQSPFQPGSQSRVTAGYALTLFMLGAVLGLLALLGRLAHELQATLLGRITAFGPLAPAAPGDLVPLLRDPAGPGATLVLAGFAASTLCLLASGLLWRRTGHPATLRERIWGRFAHTIALLLWLGMGAAAVIAPPGVRIALLVACGSAALVALAAFVYLLVEFRFLASAPPLPDERPTDGGDRHT